MKNQQKEKTGETDMKDLLLTAQMLAESGDENHHKTYYPAIVYLIQNALSGHKPDNYDECVNMALAAANNFDRHYPLSKFALNGSLKRMEEALAFCEKHGIDTESYKGKHIIHALLEYRSVVVLEIDGEKVFMFDDDRLMRDNKLYE